MPSLPSEAQERLGQQITEEHIRQAVKSMGRGKSPGTDGIPVEFYIEYLNEPAPQLLKLYNLSLEEGKLPATMRQAVITVLLKPGKDIEQCKSYRPISLIDVDTKILKREVQN